MGLQLVPVSLELVEHECGLVGRLNRRLTMATYWFRAIRWQILLAPLKAVGLRSLFSITIVGFSAIFVLGRAGEIARPIWLARREKVALTGSVATIVVERFLDAIMLIIAFVLALFAAEVPSTSSPTLILLKNGAWIIAAVAGAAMIALFVLRSNAAWIVGKIPFRRVASWMDTFLQGLSFLQDGKSLGLVVAAVRGSLAPDCACNSGSCFWE